MFRRVILGLSIFFLLIFLYFIGREILAPIIVLPTVQNTVQINTLALMLFCLCHGVYVLGATNTFALFGISAVVSWLFEEVGVATGLIYGPYHYTDMLGPKLGYVPLLIPLAWFMMIYPSYILANLIIDKRMVSERSSITHVVWLAFLSAIIMTAWDLPMDPMMSGLGNWVWEQGGPYFGVPIQNYAGWILTTFTVYLLYRLFEHRRGPWTLSTTSISVTALPIIAYGAFAFFYVFRSSVAALGLIAFFAMGLPTLLAAAQLGRLELQR